MASVFEYERDAVRVRARYIPSSVGDNDGQQVIHRKFSIDPNLTSYETLRNILSRAFELSSEAFRISYVSFEDIDHLYPLLSDWDLDAAILGASDPHLQLELRPNRTSSTSSEYSFESENDAVFPTFHGPGVKSDNGERTETEDEGSSRTTPSPEASLQSIVSTGFIRKHVNHTLPALTRKLQQALTLPQDGNNCNSIPGTPKQGSLLRSPSKLVRSGIGSPTKSSLPYPALSDKEFRSFLDNVGELVRPRELRLAVYHGGVEPQLRKVVWKHLLGIYPIGLSGKERLDYLRLKSTEYYSLKRTWTDLIIQGKMHTVETLKHITNMVRKDVLRTDRQHKFYAGDGNENITVLFNILTTYALNHPSVSYCQGMSDLLSPLLVTMIDEAHSYACFCALMQRLRTNFLIDGVSMTKKFQHLTDGLMYYDPEFYAFLKLNQADELLFCYRWLLLEMKREFDFEDALKILEILWSSLPPSHPDKKIGLPLFEVRFCPTENMDYQGSRVMHQPSEIHPVSASPRKETVYSKVASIRRRRSGGSSGRESSPVMRCNGELLGRCSKKTSLTNSSGSQEERPRIRSVSSVESSSYERSRKRSNSNKKRSFKNDKGVVTTDAPDIGKNPSAAKKITNFKDFERLSGGEASRCVKSDSKPMSTVKDDDSGGDDCGSKKHSDTDEVVYSHYNAVVTPQSGPGSAGLSIICDKLPEPTEFGDGNPFLMFLAISCLLQHRKYIMQHQMDYQDIAMHFDRMVRRHDVEKTLSVARKLFADYLNDDWAPSDCDRDGKCSNFVYKDAVANKANC